jgi:hypothetical protein
MTEKMEHLQRCPRCRYVGPMDFIAGHFACPECKQIPEGGDCCQGETAEQCYANEKE